MTWRAAGTIALLLGTPYGKEQKQDLSQSKIVAGWRQPGPGEDGLDGLGRDEVGQACPSMAVSLSMGPWVHESMGGSVFGDFCEAVS